MSKQIGQFSWPKSDSNDLDSKHKVFKRDNNRDFRLVPNLTTGETDFGQFMRLRNQLVIAAENFFGEENVSPVTMSRMSKDVDDQLTMAHMLIDVVNRAIEKIV